MTLELESGTVASVHWHQEALIALMVRREAEVAKPACVATGA